MNIEKNISLIKTKNKNTYPKNLILYFAIFYDFANKAISICTKVILLFLLISFLNKTHNFFNFIYAVSFVSVIIGIRMHYEIKKALNSENYKELSFEKKDKHKDIMGLSYFFTITFMLFLQLTPIELILGKNPYRFVLLIPFFYLYFMLEKGINYQYFLVIPRPLSITRNNYIINETIIIIITLILKFIFKGNLYFDFNINILFMFIFSIITLYLTELIIKKTFNNKKNDYVYPIHNYFNKESLIKEEHKKINKNITKTMIDIYLKRAKEEVDRKNAFERQRELNFEEIAEYRRKQERERIIREDRELVLGLKEKKEKNTVFSSVIKEKQIYSKTIDEPVSMDRTNNRR